MSIGQYDYSGLCKVFINQSQPTGKTAEGRMSFNQLSVYSYDSLLATLDPTNKVLLIDNYIAKYSNTSQRHLRVLLECATEFTIYLINIDQGPEDNLIDYFNRVQSSISSFRRARVTMFGHRTLTLKHYAEMQSYLLYLNLDRRTKVYKLAKQREQTIFATLIEHQIL